MGTFFSVLLDILAILAIIVFGSLVVVVVAELILRLLGGGKKKDDNQDKDDRKSIVKDNDIVVYSHSTNPNDNEKIVAKEEVIDGDKIEEVDYDKAVKEQKMLQARRGGTTPPARTPAPKPVEKAPANDDMFWDDDSEEDFDKFLDEVINEAKNGGSAKATKSNNIGIVASTPSTDEQDKKLEEVRKAEEKAKVAEDRAREAEERARLAEEKAREAEENAKKAVEEAQKASEIRKAEEEAKKATEERAKAEEAAQRAEDRAREAEEKAKAAEEARLAEEQARRDEELRLAQEEAKKAIDDATQKELEELRALKEQQQKELDEFKQMKEDFAREKEEQLEMLKDNLNKAKEEELERIRLDAIREQEKLERMQDELAEERQKLEDERRELEDAQEKLEEVEEGEPEQIIKETIIKDEEEINRLKYRNLMRMNARLTRIIRDTERLQAEKEREKYRLNEEREKILKQQAEDKKKEQEKQVELARQEREKILRQQEAEDKRNEIARKLEEAGKKAGKYKLDSKVVRISRNTTNDDVIEEKVVDSAVQQYVTEEKTPMKSTAKPLFDKEYYEVKLQELEEELRETEKELRINKAEYIPLTRIHKAYARDSEKLRKKEMQVAKQKVALYGVNSRNVDPAKKEKLDENLRALAELKDSVQHCEEIIKKNKDRYPVIEKNNKLITKQLQRINDDIKVCEKALEYYKKNN